MVTLEHIGKGFGSGPPILSDVSVALEPGGFYFLTGASGTGKTALIRIITLVERASRGRLRLFGVDPAGLDDTGRAGLRRRMGIVFQDLRLLDALSVRDNVALPLRIAGTPPAQADRYVKELLAWIGLAERGDAPAANLSGSERQQVALARAIIRRPELLVADEPTANTDDATAMLLLQVCERMNQLGATVLIATHDGALADRYPYQRLHLAAGRLSPAGAAAA